MRNKVLRRRLPVLAGDGVEARERSSCLIDKSAAKVRINLIATLQGDKETIPESSRRRPKSKDHWERQIRRAKITKVLLWF
ncbi:hypothetical protein CEXT_10821 [Caerostris extrusa]|uniref:Uncharacterized protein n=1 Tax=Caerostris extrusa TaxID=172846 RepID=A0AAV4NSY7_CAEEX|nr:hypothetical protein CEXT_10821 [Caerostris extrusa]